MPNYKIYDLDPRGRIMGPPEIICGMEDSDAIFAAAEQRRGVDKEIWRKDRLVQVVKAERGSSPGESATSRAVAINHSFAEARARIKSIRSDSSPRGLL